MLCSPLANSGKLVPSDTNNNNTNNNNHHHHHHNHSNGFSSNSPPKQQLEYEKSLSATTIREIKSKTIGSLSPLCQPAMINHSNNQSSIIERRQAISMERLNSIHSNRSNSNGYRAINQRRDKENIGGSGSLSSGSNSSLDDLSASDEPPTKAATGLTRSASRVSRFKSAKEFFERLSSIQNCSPAKFERPTATIGERPRGTVLNRYAPIAAAAASSSPCKISASPICCPNSPSKATHTAASPPRSRLPPSVAPFSNNSLCSSNHQSASTNSDSSAPKRSASDIELHEKGRECPQIPKLVSHSIARVNDCGDGGSSSSNNSSADDNGCNNSGENCDFVVAFRGDNVIVGNGSLLIKRNKQLKIKFDESSISTFEYPSEEAMLAEPESPAPGSPVPPAHGSNGSSTAGAPTSNPDLNRKSGIGALSNYRPSNLLIEIPDSGTIDNRLGVKNLVIPGKVPSQVSKPKVVIEHWSANNGSVIYAQSGTTNRHGPAARGSANTGKVEPQPTTNVKVYSMHLNALSEASSSGKQHAPNKELRNSSNVSSKSTAATCETNTTSPRLTPNTDNLKTIGSSAQELNRDDLSQNNTSKWSNGTNTTSDLLF